MLIVQNYTIGYQQIKFITLFGIQMKMFIKDIDPF